MKSATNVNSSFIIKIGVMAAAVLGMSVPALSFAAEYAYVNGAGEVRTVTAADAMAAIRTAPGIGVHSGVLLLDSQADQDVVGDSVSGA
ncbi:MAG TPA: hypothetical protein VEA36_01475 [Candidatus Paceibacterota bacterium]|nr:hypothetical protein [Candidatus Paceibacterota bacterium]